MFSNSAYYHALVQDYKIFGDGTKKNKSNCLGSGQIARHASSLGSAWINSLSINDFSILPDCC